MLSLSLVSGGQVIYVVLHKKISWKNHLTHVKGMKMNRIFHIGKLNLLHISSLHFDGFRIDFFIRSTFHMPVFNL